MKIVFFSENNENDSQSHSAVPRELGTHMPFRNEELNIIGATDLKTKATIRDYCRVPINEKWLKEV